MDTLLKICQQDKKNTTKGIRVVLLHEIGDGYYETMPFDEFSAFVKEGASV